ncbi:MAG: hemerythrin domain-containing protein [Spirochaetota bacterium]
MNYASEDLIKEHESILYGLKILEKMIEIYTRNKEINYNDVKEIINFFKLFADKCHHGKEEEVLFPVMERARIPKENGPIGQMLYEHDKGRNYIRLMEEGLQKKQLEFFIENALKYINLLRDHITKENNILFPLGDRRIPTDIQKNILEAFEKHEETVMGKGTHEKLHELLSGFANKYLGE